MSGTAMHPTWRKVLDLANTPSPLRHVANLSEMYVFVDTASAIDLMSDLATVTARLLDNLNERLTTAPVAAVSAALRNLPTRAISNLQVDVDALTKNIHGEEYMERRELTQRWINIVLKPALLKRVDILCVPIDEVIAPLRMWNQLKNSGYPLHASAKFTGGIIFRKAAARESAIGRFLTRNEDQSVLQSDWFNLDREFLEADFFRYANAIKQDREADLTVQPYYFVAEWAEEFLGSIRDWMLSGEAKLPNVLTKLSPEQAFAESVKWHQRLERKKQREAEEKLKTMDPGTRELLGSITMGNVTTYEAGKKMVRNDVLTIHNLMDKTSLKYESVLQHNCVETYWPKLYCSECIILHISDTQGGRWTAQIGGDAIETPIGRTRLLNHVRQLKGPTNQPAPNYVQVGLDFWLKHMNLFIYCDKIAIDKAELWRYPYRGFNLANGPCLAETSQLGNMLQKNSSARFNGKEHVIEVECVVPERMPFAARSSSDPTTKYRIIPSGHGSDAFSPGHQPWNLEQQ